MRTLVFAVILPALVAFVACGGGSSPAPTPTPVPTATPHTSPTATPTPTNFSDADLSGDQVMTLVEDDGSRIAYCMARFSADGARYISNGALLCNRPGNQDGMDTGTLTGIYDTGADGRTTLVLTPSHPMFFPFGGGISIKTVLRSDHTSRVSPQMIQPELCGTGGLYQVQSGEDATLEGSFAFHFRGEGVFLNSQGIPLMTGEAAVGRLTFDGNGSVTGTLNVNMTAFPVSEYRLLSQPISGTYTVASDGSGTINADYPFHPSVFPVPKQLKFQKISADHLVFVSADEGIGVLGEAERQRDVGADSFNGAYVFSYYGHTWLSTSYQTIAGVGQVVSGSGGTILSGNSDQNQGHTVLRNITIAGGAYTMSTDGSGTARLVRPAGDLEVVFQMVSPERAFFVNADPASLYSGMLDRQSTLVSTNTQLHDSFAMELVSNIEFEKAMLTGQVVVDGGGGIRGALDGIVNQTVLNGVPVTGTYSISDRGRAEVLFPNSIDLIVYMVSPTRGKILGMESAPVVLGEINVQ